MPPMNRWARGVGMAGLLACFAVLAWGQASTSGRISGTVTDTTGAVLPSAQVMLKNTTTNESRTATANSIGYYELLNVPIGKYELSVQMTGFKKEITPVEVQVQDQLVVNFTLQVGQVTEQVVVTGAAEVLRTTDATISGVVNNVQLSELPLNGRSFTDLIGLQAGATPVLTTGAGARTSDTRNNGGFINGADDFFNDFTVDGGDYNDLVVPGSIINKALIGTGVPPDAIQEFRVITSNEDAEFGTVAGAHIAVATKSGTNELHFTLWEYLRNDALDSRNFFDRGLFFKDRNGDGKFTPGVDTAKAPPFRLNQYGLVVGGPIKKDKHFIFGSWENYRQRLLQTRTAIVPAPRLLAALPSGPANGNLRELYAAFFPPPDPGFSPTALVAPKGTVTNVGTNRESFIIRDDHNLSDKDRLSFRIIFNQSLGTAGALLSTGIPGGNLGFTWRSITPQITYTRMLSARMVNEARFGLNRHRLTAFADQPPAAVTSLGYSADFNDRNGLPAIVSSGTGLDTLGPLTLVPQGRVVNVYQINDMLSATFGRHTLKMGGNLFAYQANTYSQDTQRPTIVFLGFGPPFDTAANGLATGTFFTQSQLFHLQPKDSSRRYVRYRHYGFFLQDNFRLRPNLTIDAGLRYEFYNNPEEKFGIQNALFQLDSSGGPIQGRRVTDIRNVGLFRTDGKPLRVGERDLNNFAPRLGLAWTPLKRLVVRAGYGISFSRPDLFGFGGTTNPPFSIPTIITNQKFGTIADPNRFLNLPQNVTVVDPGNRTTYVQKYNINLQFRLDSSTYYQIGYVGSHTVNLPLAFNPNFGGGFRGARPNANFGVISIREQIGHTSYNSVQMEFNRRFRKGLSLQAAYTFSKAMGLQEMFAVPTDLFNASVDRGPTDFDLKHMFITNWSYEIPAGPGHRVFSGGVPGLLFGRWSLSGLFWARSGQPFSIDAGTDANGDGNVSDRARLISGRGPDVLNPGGDKAQYLKPRAQVLNLILSQTTGTPLGRNTFRGPNSVNVDLALLKEIPIRERTRLQFRFETFNLFNHAILNNPVQNLGSPVFGQIISTRANSRQIQFGLKLHY